MKKTNNNSYNRIIEYLKDNENIIDSEKRYLFYYATELYKNGVENIENENIDIIIDDLKILNSHLRNSHDTNLTHERINEVLDIMDKISNYYKTKDDIADISYSLDKLYSKLDLPIRKSSSLSFNLESKERKLTK